MALICPRCRQDMVSALAGDAYQCHACGAHFDSQGDKVPTSNDKDQVDVQTGPPPEEDPTGIYDHTGPYPTPTYPTPPHPGREEDRLQADIDEQGEPVDDDKAEKAKKAKKA